MTNMLISRIIRKRWVSCGLLIVLTGAAPVPTHAQESDGRIRITADSEIVDVWSATLNDWVSPMKFWTTYADIRGGLTWGVRTDYPEYDQVSENDLMIIELEQGACLMEFFHRRWRRANDVRRWDERFNEIGGCPHVFD